MRSLLRNSLILISFIFLIFLNGCALTMSDMPSGPEYAKSEIEPFELDLSFDFGGSPSDGLEKPSSKPYKVLGKWYKPLPHARGFKQSGIASWYGKDFHGKPTSSGEVFDMNVISAAHKILPLGTYVRVRNLKNGKIIDLRINDRGPFVAGRVIDLSKAAAKALGIYGPGTAPVEVIALGAPSQLTAEVGGKITYTPIDYYKGNFTIQVGAFSDLKNAKKFWKKLDKKYKNAKITPYYPHTGGERLYRVTIGKCSTLDLAGEYEGIIKKRGFNDAFMVAE